MFSFRPSRSIYVYHIFVYDLRVDVDQLLSQSQYWYWSLLSLTVELIVHTFILSHNTNVNHFHPIHITGLDHFHPSRSTDVDHIFVSNHRVDGVYFSLVTVLMLIIFTPIT